MYRLERRIRRKRTWACRTCNIISTVHTFFSLRDLRYEVNPSIFTYNSVFVQSEHWNDDLIVFRSNWIRISRIFENSTLSKVKSSIFNFFSFTAVFWGEKSVYFNVIVPILFVLLQRVKSFLDYFLEYSLLQVLCCCCIFILFFAVWVTRTSVSGTKAFVQYFFTWIHGTRAFPLDYLPFEFVLRCGAKNSL